MSDWLAARIAMLPACCLDPRNVNELRARLAANGHCRGDTNINLIRAAQEHAVSILHAAQQAKAVSRRRAQRLNPKMPADQAFDLMAAANGRE